MRTSLAQTAAAQAVENEFEAGTLERPPPLMPYQAAPDEKEEKIADWTSLGAPLFRRAFLDRAEMRYKARRALEEKK